MKTLVKIVGTLVLFLYALSWLGVVDFYLCIGKIGSCIGSPTPVEARGLRT